jgi:hypothetical protein
VALCGVGAFEQEESGLETQVRGGFSVVTLRRMRLKFSELHACWSPFDGATRIPQFCTSGAGTVNRGASAGNQSPYSIAAIDLEYCRIPHPPIVSPVV